MIPGRALDSRVWDTEGHEYIGLSGGIVVDALEHCRPDLIAALAEQSQKLWRVSNIYTTKPTQELAQKLVGYTFADKVFFCDSGAGANEAALKLVRKYGRDHLGGHKTKTISRPNNLHGRTLFTVLVDGQPEYSKDYVPLPPGITHVPFSDIAVLETAISENTCAVIIEPIRGESGILLATQGYLQAARRLCDKHGTLLILDKVQTGTGHMGKLFAYEHYGITPDILNSAKVLGGDFPIGAVLTADRIAPAFGPGTHGSTFGGNPTAYAVDSRALNIINAPETLAHVEKQGQRLQTALRELGEKTGAFKEVRGMGLLIGCTLTDKYQGRASEITATALKYGLMILAAGASAVHFAPSLLLNDEDMGEGLKRLKTALKEWTDQDT